MTDKITEKEKKVCAVHDISCAGRCSLTVILPVISAAGIETNVIPTAVLSTHTGEFTGYTFRNLEEDILPVAQHWHSLGREYDAIYTGFFGSAAQIKVAEKLPELLGKKKDGKKNFILLVDPVMADEGKLYTGFDMNFVAEMKEYIKKADITVPNITEAGLILGYEYKEGPQEEKYIKKLLSELTETGPETAVITGVSLEDEVTGAAYFNRKTNEYGLCMRKKYPGRFYGTGDLFASAFLGGILKEKGTEKAVGYALDIVSSSVKRTYETNADRRYGVDFEMYLPDYAEKMR